MLKVVLKKIGVDVTRGARIRCSVPIKLQPRLIVGGRERGKEEE